MTPRPTSGNPSPTLAAALWHSVWHPSLPTEAAPTAAWCHYLCCLALLDVCRTWSSAQFVLINKVKKGHVEEHSAQKLNKLCAGPTICPASRSTTNRRSNNTTTSSSSTASTTAATASNVCGYILGRELRQNADRQLKSGSGSRQDARRDWPWAAAISSSTFKRASPTTVAISCPLKSFNCLILQRNEIKEFFSPLGLCCSANKLSQMAWVGKQLASTHTHTHYSYNTIHIYLYKIHCVSQANKWKFLECP